MTFTKFEETITWQPIETAPRDGRSVVLHFKSCDDFPAVTMGFWVRGDDRWSVDDQELCNSNNDHDCFTATHWMELPE